LAFSASNPYIGFHRRGIHAESKNVTLLLSEFFQRKNSIDLLCAIITGCQTGYALNPQPNRSRIGEGKPFGWGFAPLPSIPP
jgi:hypothetical protein